MSSVSGIIKRFSKVIFLTFCRFFLILFVVALVGVGCKKRVTPVALGDQEQILFLANTTEPNDLDPHIVTGVVEHKILKALFEGLVGPDPMTLEPEPGVAERWEVSKDGLTYTFYLSKYARWSNGDPVTAYDFHFSFQRMLSPNFAAEYAYMLFPLKNAQAYNRGTIDNFAQVGVKALDDRVLQLELESPIPYFLSLLPHFAWFPVHPPSILKHGAIDERGTYWTRDPDLVTNGPFKLKTWKLWDAIVVEKNPYYWGAEQVRLKQIHFLPIDNLNTEERAFRAGQVHVTTTIPRSKIETYQKQRSPYLRIDPYLSVYYYLINTTDGVLADTRVRRALSLSLNRRSIVEHILRGGEAVAFHFTPSGIAGYTPDPLGEEDPEAARRLLTEAGYPDGQGFPVLELLYNTSENHKLIAEAVQQMWRKNLNIDVKLLNQDWKVYLASRRTKDYQVARASWIGDYNDPNTFLDLWTGHSGNNHSGWIHPEYDRLIEQAARVIDPQKRFEIFRKAEAILLAESPVIPIFFSKNSYLIQPSVKNWHPNPLDWHPYKYVYLEPEKR